MAISSNLGYPRIGLRRELKKALEKYWNHSIDLDELIKITRQIRKINWSLQKEIGVQVVPSNDFSLYDHILDTTIMVGAIPERFRNENNIEMYGMYFSMARGKQVDGKDIKAMEMTKWFNTNYHYIVPEISPHQEYNTNDKKIIDEFLEAKELGIITRPVLIGPFSYLMLSKSTQHFNPLDTIEDLIPIYKEVFLHLLECEAEWLQIDEPALVFDLSEKQKQIFSEVYKTLGGEKSRPKLLLTTYFEGISELFGMINHLPIDGLHLDLISDLTQLDNSLHDLDKIKYLSLGFVDGRNIWKTNLYQAFKIAKKAKQKFNEHLFIAPSCSLLHVPQDISLEYHLDENIKSWLAFAKQKLEEIVALTEAINSGIEQPLFENSRLALETRSSSKYVHTGPTDKQKKTNARPYFHRKEKYPERKKKQKERLNLPLFPTTTIGSFPQTTEVRKNRAAFDQGEITSEKYESFIKRQIQETIHFQEMCDLDVLVHGEYERNDMVQYFAEQLTGFVFTKQGWVQSFGSRYVRPPIIYGDVTRPKPMSVKWSTYAQSLTNKPVKGMLTGPVTILQWSFVRDDQPKSATCRQIALALQDEVNDLQKAGISIIQIDEPALREGLPLKRKKWEEYLGWAVQCFRISTALALPETQIHTHMCYAEFNDIIQAIAELDADVISIEAARSEMDLLKAFSDFDYPNEIGPGIYDIHSPRIPTIEEMYSLLKTACSVIKPEQLWVNPDCGLKTRQWDEVRPALQNMVEAAKKIRKEQV